MLCEHGYTVGWDCPFCPCPVCGKPEAECPPGAHEEPLAQARAELAAAHARRAGCENEHRKVRELEERVGG